MTESMRVLQLLPALNSGGVERGTLEIAQALVSSGHDARVMSAGGRFVPELERLGAQHITRPIGRKAPATLAQIPRLAKTLRQNPVDIVHARSRLPAWVAWLAIRMLPSGRRPHFVTTLHGLHSVNAYSAIMTRGERVIAVSETVRDYIISNYPKADPRRVRVIYRGIDPDQFHPEFSPSQQWLEQWGQDYPQLKNRFIVTLPGRITRLKGHLDWLKVIRTLRDRIPGLAALVVGDTDPGKQDYAREVRRRVIELKLQDTVVFTGHRSDMREIYAISDVVCSTSTKPEAFGRTTLEALALGRPVVGWNQGGVGELLSELFPEGAVPTGDNAAMAKAIQAIFHGQVSPVRRNEIFLLKNMQQQTLTLYRELLG